jgi:hypothetical protein
LEIPDGLDVDKKALEAKLNAEFGKFIGRSLVLFLNDYLFDNLDSLSDNYSVDTVGDAVRGLLKKSLPDVVQVFVNEKLKTEITND